MLNYMSAKEAAQKWNISQRRVSTLCSNNRIKGAMMVGNMWIIPTNAEKPNDKREKKMITEKYEIKPFVKWVGGKGQLINQIEKFIDDNKYSKYAEPMVGGGALLFYVLSKFRFKELYISDINKELINAYQVIKDNVELLISKLLEIQLTFLPLDGNGRKYYYYNAREKYNSMPLNETNKIDKATLFIFLNKTCFNGLYRVNKSGEFNVPMGSYKNPTICDDDNLRNVSKALQNVTIKCGDYTISKDFIDNKTFVYIDPPYRPISQTSNFNSYNSDTFDDSEQIRLAQFISDIDKLGAKVVLSNSDPQNNNPNDTFFEELYKDFQINKIDASRMINSKSDGRGKIKELLITNR